MRAGVRIGIDVGSARIGLARTDPTPMLAIPVETISVSEVPSTLQDAVQRVIALAHEFNAIEIVVGHPINLRGEHTQSTVLAETFATAVAREATGLSIRLVDERLSTVTAASGLRAAGIKSRSQKGVIDQQAAVVLLQHAIDQESSLGTPPGRVVHDSHSSAS